MVTGVTMSTVEVDRLQLRVEGESALIDAICGAVSDKALCPDDILDQLRLDRPGLTLERLLITLYENSALFNRTRGRWHLKGAGPSTRRWPAWSGEMSGFSGP